MLVGTGAGFWRDPQKFDEALHESIDGLMYKVVATGTHPTALPGRQYPTPAPLGVPAREAYG